MRWAAKNGALAVAHQHEIGGINRKTHIRLERMARIEPEQMATLFGALDRLLAGAQSGRIAPEGGEFRVAFGQALGQGMIGRDRTETRPENSIVTGGVNGQALIEQVALGVFEREGKA